MPSLLCPEDKNQSSQAAPEIEQEAFSLLKNTFGIDVGMAKVNPRGYISKIVFSSQKPISSSKSKTFFFFFFILRDRFNPGTEEKVPFSIFFLFPVILISAVL